MDVAAARDALAAGAIESRLPVERPLDLLAQHAVTVAVGGGFRPEELLAEVRTTRAYRDLTDAEWRWVMDFITRGGPALRRLPRVQQGGRAGRPLCQSATGGAMRHRMSIGTIVSEAAMKVRFVRGQDHRHGGGKLHRPAAARRRVHLCGTDAEVRPGART